METLYACNVDSRSRPRTTRSTPSTPGSPGTINHLSLLTFPIGCGGRFGSGVLGGTGSGGVGTGVGLVGIGPGIGSVGIGNGGCSGGTGTSGGTLGGLSGPMLILSLSSRSYSSSSSKAWQILRMICLSQRQSWIIRRVCDEHRPHRERGRRRERERLMSLPQTLDTEHAVRIDELRAMLFK